MQYVVIAFDGTDSEAEARRLRARPAHFEGTRRLRAEGRMLTGGMILDDAGRTIGSVAIMDFPTRAELDAWLNADAYVTGDVWRRIEVHPFRLTP